VPETANVTRLITALLLLLLAETANAQLYKCQRPDGVIVTTNLPCAPGDAVISINGLSLEQIEKIRREEAEKKKAQPGRVALPR
jgi:hypothetical protein